MAKKQRNVSRPERRALCPGSFDPITRGHLDVISRAAGLFDRLYVAVAASATKRPLFTLAERVRLARRELVSFGNVEVMSFDGLTVDLAARLGAGWIVRGIRSGEDASRELAMAQSNRLCGPEEIHTVFLPASPHVAFVASSLVREIAALGGSLEPFVTGRVAAALRKKFSRRGAGP